MLPIQKSIPKNKLPHRQHVEALDKTVQLAVETFEWIHTLVMKDIRKLLKGDKLAKSDIKRGWTGKAPGLTIDLSDKMERVLSKYLKCLNYMMLGEGAGKEAVDMVEQLGLKGRIQPGLVFGAYLQAIDAQRAYYKTLFGKEPPEMNKTMMEKAFSELQGQTDRSVRITLDSYRNRLLDTIEMGLKENRQDILNDIHKQAHLNSPVEGKGQALEDAVDQSVKPMKLKDLSGPLADMMEKVTADFERTAETTIGMGSSVGTHQALMEVFGADDSELRCCLVSVRDDRCCEKCEEFSRNSDGSLKIHKLSAFKPAGFNFGRKKADYVLSLPLIHFKCRCSIIYVPPGFEVLIDGTIRPK